MCHAREDVGRKTPIVPSEVLASTGVVTNGPRHESTPFLIEKAGASRVLALKHEAVMFVFGAPA